MINVDRSKRVKRLVTFISSSINLPNISETSQTGSISTTSPTLTSQNHLLTTSEIDVLTTSPNDIPLNPREGSFVSESFHEGNKLLCCKIPLFDRS